MGHQHYATNPAYTHFLVLTQSCDLAVRQGQKFRAPYVTICAAKPLSAYLDKKLAQVFAERDPIRVGRSAMYKSAESVIKRLISNTSDEVFFLDALVAPSVNEPLCAFLQLSIALKAEHYDALLRAKQAEMTDIFSAKIGWMTGNLYSRVGTPDLYETNPAIAEAYERQLVESLLERDTEWLDNRQISQYRKEYKTSFEAKAAPLTADEARQIARACPKPIQELSGAVLNILNESGLIADNKTFAAVKNRIESNNKLRGFASRGV